jgi:hypothetical protein
MHVFPSTAVASSKRKGCSRVQAVLLLVINLLGANLALADITCGGTNDPDSDEISYIGESVSSVNQWPSSSGWGISFRKIIVPCFAASLAYLNDGHFPGHHRDGVTSELWLPIDVLGGHVRVSAGGGPFYYFDTVVASNTDGYADAHDWAWLVSFDVMYRPWLSGVLSHLFIEARFDHTAPTKSIETNSIGLGIGYRGFSDFQRPNDEAAAESFGKNELSAYYWKTVVNSFTPERARAEEVEYRREIWSELHASLGFLNEGDAQLIRRNGVIFQGWAEPSFNEDLWSIGAGFGGYAAIDKYRPAPGRHVSGIISATLSLRPLKNFDIRFLWHRIVTDYNRDTDIVLWGIGYRF